MNLSARSMVYVALGASLVACDAGEDPGQDTDSDAVVTCTPTMPTLDWSEVASGFEVFDTSYKVSWSGADRTVPVNLWYPTTATEGDAAKYRGTFIDTLALDGAPFVDPAPGCKLPLVVYSHGSQGWAGAASPLLRNLARQGWVAAAPDHIGNTIDTDRNPRAVSFSLTRVEDMRATLDALESLPDDHPLHNRVDTSRVLLIGHSFGGQTAWLFSGPTFDAAAIATRCDESELGCTQAELDAFAHPVDEPRVVAVLPLDGGVNAELVADAGWSTATRPVLMLSQEAADQDNNTYTHAALAADVTWVQVKGSCHESFTSNQIACPGLSKPDGLTITSRFVNAFASVQVLGLSDARALAVLDGTGDTSDKLILKHRVAP